MLFANKRLRRDHASKHRMLSVSSAIADLWIDVDYVDVVYNENDTLTVIPKHGVKAEDIPQQVRRRTFTEKKQEAKKSGWFGK